VGRSSKSGNTESEVRRQRSVATATEGGGKIQDREPMSAAANASFGGSDVR
jgi:hypothetical protein